ncbi:MAG: type II secretion system protein [Fimbriimonadaceae bacterium]|nr:type II secretion system protein [Fimbriimonadaceae bacterium]
MKHLRRTKRGFTLPETVITASLSAVVVGASATLFAFSVRRVQSETVELNVVSQAHALADDIGETMSNAIYVTTDNSNEAQKVLIINVPSESMDSDFDGSGDVQSPSMIGNSGREVYGSDRMSGYVWGPSADGTYQTVMKLDRPNGSSQPWLMTVDEEWSKQDGQPRWKMIRSVDFVNDPIARTTKVTIIAGANLSTGDAPDAANDGRSTTYRLERTYCWGTSL